MAAWFGAVLVHPEPWTATRIIGRRLFVIGVLPLVFWVLIPAGLRAADVSAAEIASPLVSAYGRRLSPPAFAVLGVGALLWCAGAVVGATAGTARRRGRGVVGPATVPATPPRWGQLHACRHHRATRRAGLTVALGSLRAVTNGETLRGDLEFQTIPRLVEAAAERWPGADAIVDVDGGVRRPSRSSPPTAPGGARAHRAGRRARRPRRGLGAQHLGVGGGRAWPARGGRRARPAQHALQGRRGGRRAPAQRRRALFTVTGFLGTDYVGDAAAARDVDRCPRSRTIVVLRGDAPAGHARLGRLPRARGDAVTRGRRRGARARGRARRPLRHPVHVGHHGPPKGVPCTHAQTLRAFRDWAEVVGLRAGDRYLVVQPVLPHASATRPASSPR